MVLQKVKCANQLLTSEQLTYYTISKSWLSGRQHKNQPSTIGYLHTLTFWSHLLVKNIEIGTDAIDTSRGDTDVIMEETLVPIVTDCIGSTSLNDLILAIAEIQMTSWKPDIQGIMQQFQEYDNEGYNIYRCLFDVVQNSEL